MLRLTRKLMFAIEAVVDIAYNSGEHPVQSKDIAERVEQGLEGPRDAIQERLVDWIALGVRRGEATDLALVGGAIVAQQQPAAVAKRRKRGRISRDQAQAAGRESQLAHDHRAQQSDDIGGARHLEAGPQLFRP